MASYTVTQPSWFSSTLELNQDGRRIGDLVMLKKWSYALAEARMPNGTFHFGYKGWTTRDVFLRDQFDKDIASAKSLSWWSRDTAVTIEGKEYLWKRKSAWGTSSSWLAPDGSEIMEFSSRWWKSTWEIDVPAPLDKTGFLLLSFGMYLTKLQEMDGAASGSYVSYA